MTNPGNDNLRRALANAGISGDELADLLKVDTRTVRRWLNGQPPYPRHRYKIAGALDLTEHDLWPEITPPAGADAQALKASSAARGETITGYSHSNDPGAPETVTLISSATARIELLDETLYPLLTQPGVPELLIAKASQGCTIRILVASPVPCLMPVLGQPGIEIQVFEGPDPISIHRADHQMLIVVQLGGLSDERPVLLHVTQQLSGGVFDRLAEHYQSIWDAAIEPIMTERDIDRYLFDDEADEDLPGEGRHELDEADQRRAEVEPPQPPQRQATTPPPRRWPRRPPAVE
jgi:transcriptional regulator with XRE-family HTH domain